MLGRCRGELKADWRNCLNKSSILLFAARDAHAVLRTVANGRVEERIIMGFGYSNCKECSPTTLAAKSAGENDPAGALRLAILSATQPTPPSSDSRGRGFGRRPIDHRVARSPLAIDVDRLHDEFHFVNFQNTLDTTPSYALVVEEGRLVPVARAMT
jgi:hypothetical protein